MSKTKKAVVTAAAVILFSLSYMSNVALYYVIDRDEIMSATIPESAMTLILVVLIAIIIAGAWSIESVDQ